MIIVRSQILKRLYLIYLSYQKYQVFCGPVDSNKKETVTAATTNNFALKNGDNSVSYTLKKAENDTNATTSFEFDAASINAEGGASQAIGVDVEDFAGTPAGTYTDTIQFKGTMTEKLFWTENDKLRVSLRDNNRNYYNFRLVGNLKSGTIKYQKSNLDDSNTFEEKDAELNISGNVFTFSCAEVSFKLDFSKQSYAIIGGDSFMWDVITHTPYDTPEAPHSWLMGVE